MGVFASHESVSGTISQRIGAVVETSPKQCYREDTPSARAMAARNQEDTVLTHHAEAATQTAAEEASPMPSEFESAGADALLERILSSLAEDKAEEVVTIDLRGKSEMADHMVVCSGRSSRQVAAISEKLVERLKADFGISSKVEGKDAGDWVLIDAGDVIVHVFRPEVREFYQLEKMWLPAGGTGKAGSQA
ncbi:ribosome-associated protein [Aliiruegeria lutimaris]|uniref:Ribosomal silencing factor RsfS n=2 Tax=Aliiruegeria lutimaris TaxID=571298 RepID=A0A1G8P8M5_9RHOB|nr:ribosome-associated protein [Aliiruegeria lutimaris]